MKNIITLTVRPSLGAHFQEVAKEALNLAQKLLVEIEFEFNGMLYYIRPTDTLNDIYSKFGKGLLVEDSKLEKLISKLEQCISAPENVKNINSDTDALTLKIPLSEMEGIKGAEGVNIETLYKYMDKAEKEQIKSNKPEVSRKVVFGFGGGAAQFIEEKQSLSQYQEAIQEIKALVKKQKNVIIYEHPSEVCQELNFCLIKLHALIKKHFGE